MPDGWREQRTRVRSQSQRRCCAASPFKPPRGPTVTARTRTHTPAPAQPVPATAPIDLCSLGVALGSETCTVKVSRRRRRRRRCRRRRHHHHHRGCTPLAGTSTPARLVALADAGGRAIEPDREPGPAPPGITQGAAAPSPERTPRPGRVSTPSRRPSRERRQLGAPYRARAGPEPPRRGWGTKERPVRPPALGPRATGPSRRTPEASSLGSFAGLRPGDNRLIPRPSPPEPARLFTYLRG